MDSDVTKREQLGQQTKLIWSLDVDINPLKSQKLKRQFVRLRSSINYLVT